MASPVKKRRALAEDSISGNEDDSEELDGDESDSDGEGADQEIQVEFEARSPEECDFHGIKAFLAQLFLKGHVDVSAMASAIVAQSSVGCILQQYVDAAGGEGSDVEDEDDGDEIFGVTSCLALSEKQNEGFSAQLQSFLLDKCLVSNSGDSSSNGSKEQLRQTLKELLDGGQVRGATEKGSKNVQQQPANRVGLLVSERLINIPPKIAIPTYESLLKDLRAASSQDPAFKFHHYVMILKKCIRRQEERKGKRKGRGSPEIIYVNPEEEFFSEVATFRHSYSVVGERDSAVGGEWDDGDELYEPWREIIVLPAVQLQAVVERMKSEIVQ